MFQRGPVTKYYCTSNIFRTKSGTLPSVFAVQGWLQATLSVAPKYGWGQLAFHCVSPAVWITALWYGIGSTAGSQHVWSKNDTKLLFKAGQDSRRRYSSLHQAWTKRSAGLAPGHAINTPYAFQKPTSQRQSVPMSYTFLCDSPPPHIPNKPYGFCGH